MPIKVLLLRYTHPDGSEKDWGYPVETCSASPAFTVFYGRAGSALRQTETPAAECHDRNPAREAERREREKRAKGYYVLGEFWLADNRRELTRVTPSGVVPTSAAPPVPPAPARAARHLRSGQISRPEQGSPSSFAPSLALTAALPGWAAAPPNTPNKKTPRHPQPEKPEGYATSNTQDS